MPGSKVLFNIHESEQARLREVRQVYLPIQEKKDEIISAVKSNQVVIVVGETGSGKTTQIPLYLFEAGFGEKGLIGITQPRRVAATSVARYTAGQLGSQVGKEVGYKIRFDDSTTEGTTIKFMTDGILLREMQDDPNLSTYEIIVVDEAHERSLNIDFTLGLLKDLLKRRPELKVLVVSATIDAEKFAKYFGKAPIISVSGRMYSVNTEYRNISDFGLDNSRLPEIIAQEVMEIHSSKERGKEKSDILVFLPGQDDIKGACREIEERNLSGLAVLPLYGEMSPEEQDRIFTDYAQRKVVLATNIAETSITLDGVVYVIDSGLIKQTDYNPETGIGSLSVVPHSKAGCNQRAGRAGRTQAGVCIRLYSEEDYESRSEFTEPEILRTDLAGIVLQMKSLDIQNIENFDFIDQPDKQTFHDAHESLITLGALDRENGLTETGKLMAKLPVEPRIGRMIVEASKRGCIEEVITIAGGLSVRSVFVRPKGKEYDADTAHEEFKNQTSDFLTLLNVWSKYVTSGYSRTWAVEHFLNFKALEEINQVRDQLFEILYRAGIPKSKGAGDEAIVKSVTAGLVENLCEHYSRFTYQSGERLLFIHPSSTLFSSSVDWFVCASVVETKKTYARSCQEIEPEWLLEIAPQLCQKVISDISVRYGLLSYKVIATEVVYFNSHKISEKEIELKGEQAEIEIAWKKFQESHPETLIKVKPLEDLPALPEPVIFHKKGAQAYPFLYCSWEDKWSLAWTRNREEASYANSRAIEQKAEFDAGPQESAWDNDEEEATCVQTQTDAIRTGVSAEEEERKKSDALKAKAQNLCQEVEGMWSKVDAEEYEEYSLSSEEASPVLREITEAFIPSQLREARMLAFGNSGFFETVEPQPREAMELLLKIRDRLKKALEYYESPGSGEVTKENLEALQEKFRKH